MNKLILLSLAFFLTACSGSSDSGGVEETESGDMLPANFVGVYRGFLNVTAEAAGLTESDRFEITITVFSDGTIRFDGDDPDETFTVGITNEGNFAGNLEIEEDECQGTVGVVGSVDGTTASGTVEGSGECEIGGLDIEVDLEGDFSATK